MVQARLKRYGSYWVLTRLGRSADCSRMPIGVGDKIRLGIAMEVVGNEELQKSGGLSRKWEEPVVNGLSIRLPTRGVRGLCCVSTP
jgi:hypothetical protein